MFVDEGRCKMVTESRVRSVEGAGTDGGILSVCVCASLKRAKDFGMVTRGHYWHTPTMSHLWGGLE